MRKIILLISGLLIFTSIYGQNTTKIKQSQFLFGFGRLLSWSSYQNDDYKINVYGQSVITDFINTFSYDKTSGGRNVVASQSSLDNIGNCNVLFITNEKIGQLSQINNLLVGKQVLIVTEAAGYTNSGADVSFTYRIISQQDSVLVYSINLQSIRAKNIKISPEFIGYCMVK
ncbi:MAG: YfiR family protein [Bacteroidota bacterium]|nr:YfiR family protein [Bacteroidota bacterium]